MNERPIEPTIVCLCGSTRFFRQFQEANYRLTMEGFIVLAPGFYPHGYVHCESIGVTPEQKKQLDELHLRKIDLADEVHVLNVGGYVGESTFNEIVYAAMKGCEISLLEPDHSVELWSRVAKELHENRNWSNDMIYDVVPTEFKAQVKARLAWLDWDDAEIEHEVERLKAFEGLRKKAEEKAHGIHND